MLDFSKMKKIATDGKTTTFAHEKGHTMTILHAALPRIQQEQIKRIKITEKEKPEEDKEEQKFAKGTPDGTVEDKPDDSAPVVADSSNDTASVPTSSGGTHITINAAAAAPPAPAPAPAPPTPAPPPVSVPHAAQAAVPAMPAGRVAALPNLMNRDNTINLPAAVGLQQQSIGEQAGISGAMAGQQAQAEKEYLASQKRIQDQAQQNFQNVKKHADEFNAYIRSNPINPSHYQESQTSGQKAQTAIGLFLGGLGGGGTSNVALDFLNKQIDRDIAAQQKNVDNRATVWGAYQHLYEDSKMASDMARVSANDILTHKVQMEAAKLGTPQAIQKAHELAAQKAIENNQILVDAAGRLGTLQVGRESRLSSSVSVKNSKGGGKKYVNTTTILKPGTTLDKVKFNPTAKVDYDKVREQYDRATQADKAIASIDGTFGNMETHSTNPDADSYKGYFHRQIAPEIGHIPLVGSVFGAAEKAVTDNPDTRAYASAQSELYKVIRTALPDATDDSINKLVKDNSPERGDDSKMIEEKKRVIKDFIKRNTPTSLLKQYGLSNS